MSSQLPASLAAEAAEAAKPGRADGQDGRDGTSSGTSADGTSGSGAPAGTAAAAAPPLLLVINRFDDEFGEYHRFLRDTDHRLAYLATADALAPLDLDGAVETVVVPDLDHDTLLAAARRITDRHGPLAGIVGVSEFDLSTAARLRAELGVPGWSSAYTDRFRDKTLMKQWILRAGLRAPAYREIGPGADAPSLVAEFGLPLILKPRDGAASRGVVLVRTEQELVLALADVDSPQGYEAEEYVEGAIHHVDGIRRGGRFHFVSVSRYVNTCLDFTQGVPLGSVLLDPGPRREELTGFTADCLDALELRDGPFHLEVIVTASGEPVFLEVGLRPGGAGVPFLHRDLFGIDLFEEAFRTTVGLPPLTAEEDLRTESAGGWLVFPEPRPWPARVTGRTSLVGDIPEVYAEALPRPGHVFDGQGGYDHAGGRFLLRGANEAQVREAVLAAIDRYVLETEPAAER
ncbi:ATP-grasp domain-containing protein [Actinacidiphila sp. ITFR-21]|uniref:ATP-grasp domain-containing protein n=1 Tax=Actinacidiphila sp. ITFR-21 TaxID=3075199 RepID=UPI00288A5517|nr:ATP-grasp domain-containing protein [Streptomyces sp. ITFR-21]WNI18651.1 ATP-grasp domain-containing protein [Streptomyces sp. ITFR-21]